MRGMSSTEGLRTSAGSHTKLAALRAAVADCRRCPELRRYCAAVAVARKREFADQTYWGRPVPSLGDTRARLLIVGLAPAAHGGNRTGRMFTGDGSAAWLSRALFRSGFATAPHSTHRGDGFPIVIRGGQRQQITESFSLLFVQHRPIPYLSIR